MEYTHIVESLIIVDSHSGVFCNFYDILLYGKKWRNLTDLMVVLLRSAGSNSWGWLMIRSSFVSLRNLIKPNLVTTSPGFKRFEHLCWPSRLASGLSVSSKFESLLVEMTGSKPSKWGISTFIFTMFGCLRSFAVVYLT